MTIKIKEKYIKNPTYEILLSNLYLLNPTCINNLTKLKSKNIIPIKDKIFSLVFILILTFPSIKLIFIKEIPNPTNKLNNEPAIEPVKAISPQPLFTKDKFKTLSEIQFPKAKTVIPKNVEGMFNKSPKVVINDIKLFAENQTHNKLKAKEIIEIKNSNLKGGLSFKFLYK